MPPPPPPPFHRREHLHPLSILFAGGMAGVFFWVVAIVPDTLKSRLQTGRSRVVPIHTSCPNLSFPSPGRHVQRCDPCIS